MRDVLKKHKRLSPSQRTSNITVLQDALNGYIPYLLAIYNGSPDAYGATSYGGVTQIAITETKELLTGWRSTLSPVIPGREAPRIRVPGLRNELAFALQTLAYTYTHQARAALLELHRTVSPSAQIRTGLITSAMKYLLDAQRVHAYVATLHQSSDSPPPLDVAQSTASGLASLALSEATLIVVFKDDPHAAAVAEERNKDSKEWMVAAPSIPKVRAHLFARLCITAADHAAKAGSLLVSSGKIDDDLVKYSQDLRKTARGKAARFLGIDAEVSGKTGEGIAWLRAAKREMGVIGDDDDGKKKGGLRGLKQSWTERREDRRMEKGAEDWGLDAGRLDEIRVVEWLEAKWIKSNDTVSLQPHPLWNDLLMLSKVNVQAIPAFEPLLATMPSGREYHSPKPYIPPSLDPSILNTLRAPVDPSERAFLGAEDDSGDDGQVGGDPVGAFPGTSRQYGSAGSSYY